MKTIDWPARTVTSLKTALTLSVGLSALAAVALPAVAQDTGDDNARKLDKVTVTATKTEQTLQDIPIAVSVVDQLVIEEAQINDIIDLQSVVPSLRVSQLQQSANTSFIIRGFGNGANNIGIEPSVSVFIDGVFRTRAAGGLGDYADISRVEVLRGPQSTLFGKNSSAGVVNVVTQAPEFELGGHAEVTFGNFNQQIVKGRLTGPITDKLAFAVTGSYNQRDGFADVLNLGEDQNDRNRFAVKGQLQYEPTENLTFRLIADHDELDELCCFASTVINGPTGVAIGAITGDTDLINATLAGVPVRDPFDFEGTFNTNSENEITNTGVSLQADWDTGLGTFTYIGSFRDQDSLATGDGDFTSADIVANNVFSDYNIQTQTHEVRLAGNTDRFNYLLGAFYFDEDLDSDSSVGFGADFIAFADLLASGAQTPADVVGSLTATATGQGTFDGISALLTGAPGNFFAEGTGSFENFTQDNRSISLFAQGDFDVTDKLTATLGLSYIRDKKDVTATITNTDLFSSLDLATEFNDPFRLSVLSPALAGTSFDNIVLDTAFGVVAGGAAAAGAPLPFADLTALATAAATGDPVAGAVLGQVQGAAQDPNLIAGVSAGTAAAFADPFGALQFLPGFVNFPNAVEDGSTEDDQITVTARLAYDVNDNINVYGSYATGFKASSFNLTRDSSFFPEDFAALQAAGVAIPNNRGSGTRFAGPEDTEVFEIGAKLAFDTFTLNVAAFDQTIEGFQSQLFTGTGFVLANAGEQSTRGVEFDATWLPLEGLTLSLAGIIQDPQFDEFTGATVAIGSDLDLEDGIANGVGDLTGERPAGISTASLTFGGRYERDLTDDLSGFVRAGYNFESDVQVVDNIEGVDREVGTLDASFGVSWDSGLSVSFWGRNLNNDEFFTSAFPAVAQAGSVLAYPNQPRTYGISLRADF